MILTKEEILLPKSPGRTTEVWLPGMDSNQGLRYDAVADEL